ncbi:MAG: hypothetical protein ABSF48_19350, partial [Thermodesulfobacteriota bacterium]
MAVILLDLPGKRGDVLQFLEGIAPMLLLDRVEILKEIGGGLVLREPKGFGRLREQLGRGFEYPKAVARLCPEVQIIPVLAQIVL